VDESLFSGGKTRTASSAGRSSAGPLSRNGTAIVSAQLVQQLTSPAHAKETVVISDRELKNMMTLTAGRQGFAAQQAATFGQQHQSPSSFGGSQSLRATSAGTASKAQARKEKMARLEREAALRRNQPSADGFETDEKEERQRLLGAAKQAMDEEMDDVKVRV
jgi:hypothetical protein